jgi:uncharacterized protein (TIGR03437 family)
VLPLGSDLATSTGSAASLPLGTSMNRTSVTIGGKPAPLVFVSAGQVNAQVPYEDAGADNVPVIVTVNGVASVAGTVSVVGAAPGLFQFGNSAPWCKTRTTRSTIPTARPKPAVMSWPI